MASLAKIVGITVGVGVTYAAVLYGIAFGANYIKTNEQGTYNHERGLSVKYVGRPDWKLGSIEFRRWDGVGDQRLDIVVQRNFLKKVGYGVRDGGRLGPYDGKVDSLEFSNGVSLIREENYPEFQEEFDKADEFLTETKERFKDIINQ